MFPISLSHHQYPEEQPAKPEARKKHSKLLPFNKSPAFEDTLHQRAKINDGEIVD